jgi:hypothetical protein
MTVPVVAGGGGLLLLLLLIGLGFAIRKRATPA